MPKVVNCVCEKFALFKFMCTFYVVEGRKLVLHVGNVFFSCFCEHNFLTTSNVTHLISQEQKHFSPQKLLLVTLVMNLH